MTMHPPSSIESSSVPVPTADSLHTFPSEIGKLKEFMPFA